MKYRYGILLVAGLAGIGLLAKAGGAGAVTGPDQASVGMVAATVSAGDYEYVGSKKCKKCHIPQYKSWEKGKKGHALETLKPGQATEAKQKHELDSAKDYSTDESCLKCHTTGFGHATGYAIPDPEDKKAVKRAKKLAGVGCESCHGPGSAYVKVFEEITKSKRTYKVEELYAVGLNKIEEATCTACHNEQGPTFDAANPFDFEKMKEQGAHEHTELKQREQ